MPDGFGALWANNNAAFARERVLIGNVPFGAPPAGPANDVTFGYFPAFEPPGFSLDSRVSLDNGTMSLSLPEYRVIIYPLTGEHILPLRPPGYHPQDQLEVR